VSWLLGRLREAGTDQEIATLLGRPRQAGVRAQAAALADRAAAHVPLDDPWGVAELLDSLREACAQAQAAALADRLPGAGLFKLFREQESRRDQFQFGRETDGSPAGPWDGKIWTDIAGLVRVIPAGVR
jgi:hypothetical protein